MKGVRRLGVLGGTFDPLHLGHFRAAESAQEAMALDRILFVPSRTPPHKARPGITAAEDRFLMIQAAVDKEPAFEASRVEVDREGPSYTVDTLAEIKQTLPSAEIFFITGIDSFREIQTWRKWRELLQSFSFIVHGRPGSPAGHVSEIVLPAEGSPLRHVDHLHAREDIDRLARELTA